MNGNNAIRHEMPITIMMIDMIFKPYNDTLGHIQGDECLGELLFCWLNSRGVVIWPHVMVVRSFFIVIFHDR